MGVVILQLGQTLAHSPFLLIIRTTLIPWLDLALVTYTLTLHQPVENWIKDGAATELDPIFEGNTPNHEGIGLSPIITYPIGDAVDVSNGIKNWAAAASVGTIVYSAVDPPTWALAILGLLNYEISSVDPPPTDSTATPVISVSQFYADAQTQRNSYGGIAPGIPYHIFREWPLDWRSRL